MALQPSLSYTRFGCGPNTLELYLDLLCPFSAKMTRFLSSHLVPQVQSGGKYNGKLCILIRPYPQPWHASSTNVQESAVAFGKAFCTSGKEADSELWFKFWKALMDDQESYFDIPIKDTTAEQIRDRLSILAGQVAEDARVDTASKAAGAVRSILSLKGSANSGNDTSADLKWLCKLGRQNGIHVTPSAVFNGIFDGSVSSGWLEPEWSQFLESKGL